MQHINTSTIDSPEVVCLVINGVSHGYFTKDAYRAYLGTIDLLQVRDVRVLDVYGVFEVKGIEDVRGKG